MQKVQAFIECLDLQIIKLSREHCALYRMPPPKRPQQPEIFLRASGGAAGGS